MIPSESKWTTVCNFLSDLGLAMNVHGMLRRCEVLVHGEVPVGGGASTRISYDAGDMAAWSAERKAWSSRAVEFLHRPLTSAIVIGFIGVASCVMELHC